MLYKRNKKGQFVLGSVPPGNKNAILNLGKYALKGGGAVPWNKGKKVRLNIKGEFKKGIVPWNKGQKLGKQSIETIIKRAEKNRGQKRNEETREKIRQTKIGSKNPAWKGGVKKEHELIRSSAKYKEWRISVFARDNYTCQICGHKGGYLEADHIKPFALFPELRFEISNGRTLCKSCHFSNGFRIDKRDNCGRFIKI